MKKTLTAALALTAFASIAFADKATINTDPAGCIEKTASDLVCNPFVSFSNPASDVVTLGDLDGSKLANTEYISFVSQKGVMTKYYWFGGHWNTAADGSGTESDGVVLNHGDAMHFSTGDAARSLVISGILTNNLAVTPQKEIANGGYTLVGNVLPVATNLAAFAISNGGSYDAAKDYLVLGGNKYVFKSGHWYLREGETETLADTTTVAAGQGFFIFCKKRPRGWNTTYITLPVAY